VLWPTIFAKSLDGQLTVLLAAAVSHQPVSVHPSQQQAAEKLDLRASICSARTKNLSKCNDRSVRPEALEGGTEGFSAA